MSTPVKIGTTIAGTWDDGPGFPSQSHLIYAANAGVWWYFTITSASDTAGNPGTHVIKCYVSSGANLATATWTAKTDSPNMDGDSASVTSKLWHGRSLGILYINNAAGSNKDIIHASTSIYPDKTPDSGNGVSYHIRAVLTATTITWGTFGSYGTANFNWGGGADTDTVLISGNAIGITKDGYIQVGAAVYHSELDCSVLTSAEVDTGDTWTAGGNGTGNHTAGGSLVTNMANQTGLKAGYGVSDANQGITSNGNAKVNTIDSSTQITLSNTWLGTDTGVLIRWNNMTPGANRATSAVVDNTMGHKCTCYSFWPLGSGSMVVVYDNGSAAPPNLTNLKSMRSNQTQAQGFWPSTNDGTGSVTVFSGDITQDSQDWCAVGVDPFHVYAARRHSNTVVDVNQFDPGKNTWAALPSQPAALTGKVIKAGGGIMGVTDGVDLWLFVINSTDNEIDYAKYTSATATWSAWTLVAAVDATATKLSGYPFRASAQAGLVYSVTNGGNFDTYVATLSVPDAVIGYSLPDIKA